MDEKYLELLARHTGMSKEETRRAVTSLMTAANSIVQSTREAFEELRKAWEEAEGIKPQLDLTRMKQEAKTERHPLRKRQLQREIQRLEFTLKNGSKQIDPRTAYLADVGKPLEPIKEPQQYPGFNRCQVTRQSGKTITNFKSGLHAAGIEVNFCESCDLGIVEREGDLCADCSV